jgi:hypothetical protein
MLCFRWKPLPVQSPHVPGKGKLNQRHPVAAGAGEQRVSMKADAYVQPSTVDMLAGASPASAMDGWAE